MSYFLSFLFLRRGSPPTTSRRGISRLDLLASLAAIGLVVSVFLPNMVKSRDKSREAEVKANIHGIQVALERFATDNSGTYPAYILGGSVDAWSCVRSAKCNPSKSPSPDLLLRGGYIGRYPANPFYRDARVCSWTGMDPRFGCVSPDRTGDPSLSGRIMGNALTDPHWALPDNTGALGALSPDGRPYYFLNDGDPATHDWLPGQFLYRSHGESQGRQGNACGMRVSGTHCTSGPTIPLFHSYYFLGAYGSTKSHGGSAETGSRGGDYLHCYDPTDSGNGFGIPPSGISGCTVAAGSYDPLVIYDREPTLGTPDLDGDGDTDEIPNVVFQEAGSSLVVGGAIGPSNSDGQSDGLLVFFNAGTDQSVGMGADSYTYRQSSGSSRQLCGSGPACGGGTPANSPNGGTYLQGGTACPGCSSNMPPGAITGADTLLILSSYPSTPPAWRPGQDEPPQRPTAGFLEALDTSGEAMGDFPLTRTDVEVEISGYIARTEVTQVFENSFSQPIEAVYTFPLGARSAVTDFVMEVEGRRIVGIVRPREEARRIYEEARARGQTASLLTQERPNIFTEHVANVAPGGSVTVSLTTFERLAHRRGEYEYVFPMVVGPRYMPGQPSRPWGRESGGGWSPPTSQVPNADRISPPVLPPAQRSGTDVGLRVRLDAGMPIIHLQSVAHQTEEVRLGPGQRLVTLARRSEIPNRDFVLRWQVDPRDTTLAAFSHGHGGAGYFTMIVQPPPAPRDDQVIAREITFILDRSGSMGGLPISMSKRIVDLSLDSLRPQDTFNLYTFANGNDQLWPTPRPANRGNLAAAKSFLGRLQGGGGTEMLAGVRRAIQGAHDPERVQMFVFLTDGFVGNDVAIVDLVRNQGGNARFFAFGIGSSVNHNLIQGVAEAGHGTAHAVIPRDQGHAERAAQFLFEAIDSPVLTDLVIDWGGLPVADVYPERLPDLFAGQAVTVIGRYTGPASGQATVFGHMGSKTVRLPIRMEFRGDTPGNEALAPLWARARIHDLETRMGSSDLAAQATLRARVTDLAVAYRLASQYTAFVAVDQSRVVGDGMPLRIIQPVPMPEGVSYEGVFGESPLAQPSRIAAWGALLVETGDGSIRVFVVEERGPLATAGIEPGARLTRVGRTAVEGLGHLDRLILQSTGTALEVHFEAAGTVRLPMP